MEAQTPPLYLQIAESIRRRIAAGELRLGDRIAPVREMARRWNCTAGTVSRAYGVLGREGLLVGRAGKGTVVNAGPIHSQERALGWAALVNRAERYLLDALNSGHGPVEAETAISVAAARLRELQAHAQPSGLRVESSQRDALRFIGSHDMAVDVLARLLRGYQPAVELSIEYAGSLGGLIALARSAAELAGVHLWDETTNTYNTPYIQRILPGGRVAQVTLAHRRLGLIVQEGNPLGVRELGDLTRSGLRFVNRQPGSGTRVWLDAQLRRLGIQTRDVDGYDQEQTTHLGVAQTIARGTASAGLGIQAAARGLGLGFIPLTLEQYDLVIPETSWEIPPVQTLMEVVRSARLREAISALGGYDVSQTGKVNWLP